MQEVTVTVTITFLKVTNPTLVSILGIKIRNLKVNFKTGGTWRRVGQ